ncbi:MAG: NapC/NirT family cytochrome c [Ignavibacteriaceae bacterium]|nr:NapC/NirT family cytochrome c [Ignavibacteriaceae bacterium]
MRKIFPSSVYNPVSFAGALLASISFGLILFLIMLEVFNDVHKPYIGILAFVILPVFLISGLIIIAFGIYREHKREKSGKYEKRKFPVINLNDKKHLAATMVFVVGSVLLLVFSAFGTFKAYEYTDSDEFCGTVCHTVMAPEYTAYLNSPHSRVGCVKCHIGDGAEWFVRAKVSGSYQFYSVLFNKYSRPIPTPIANLRPAQETCEQCHWPKHFYGEKKITLNYFIPDENNTKSSLTMLMRVGGGSNEHGISTGIHWHMNIDNEIFYVPTDETRQQINWMMSRNKVTGEEKVFRLKDDPGSLKTPDEKLWKKMDCMDCHNRPAHIYNEPGRMVNLQMEMGNISPSLPYIKSIAVQALETEYSTNEEAMKKIESFIKSFYFANYPEVSVKDSSKINFAIETIKKIYSRNYFPEMRVSWKYYPNHIGHLNYDGCFRCHDGKHETETGLVLSNDCNSCHVLLQQETPQKGNVISMSGVDYVHPGGIPVSLETQKCSDCHGVPIFKPGH